MAWQDDKNTGDVVDASEWTIQANTIEEISGSYYGHSSNVDKHFPSSQLINWLDSVYAPTGAGDLTQGEADALYYPSSLGNGLNTSYYNHSGVTDIHYPSSQFRNWLDGIYAPTGAGGLTQNEADALYYPSSLGSDLNTSYYNHSGVADIHYPSSQLINWLDGVYAPTGAGGLTKDQADGYYHPSGYGTFAYISTSRYITHTDDPYSKLDFQNNALEIIVGDLYMITMVSGGAYGIIVNSGSKDIDFDVRGKTDSDLFHIDANNDTVNIGTVGGINYIFNVDGEGFINDGLLATNYVSSATMSMTNIVFSGKPTITATNLKTLTDTSNADSLHTHSGIGATPHSGVVYVGKHGADDNDGLNIDEPFLTVASGLNYAGSIATSSWPIVVFVFDGEYTEGPITISSNVSLIGQSRDGTIIKNTSEDETPFVYLNSNTSIKNCYIYADASGSIALSPHESPTSDVYIDNVKLYAKRNCYHSLDSTNLRNSIISNISAYLDASGSTDSTAFNIKSSGSGISGYEPVILKDSYIYAHKSITNGLMIGLNRVGNTDENGRVEIFNTYVLVDASISSNIIGFKKAGLGQSVINGLTVRALGYSNGLTIAFYNDGTTSDAHGLELINSYFYGHSPTGKGVGLYSNVCSVDDINKFYGCTFRGDTNSGTEYDIEDYYSGLGSNINPIEMAGCHFRPDKLNLYTEREGLSFKQEFIGFYPPMTFNVASIAVSAQQNINVARFTTPGTQWAYVYQAAACDTSGDSVDDLYIELLSGSTTVYKTSSNVLQQGLPLASSQGDLEIRFMYSGAGATGVKYGSGFMNLGVY